MYRLISAAPSPYARKVRIALAEKAIPFELIPAATVLDRQEHAQRGVGPVRDEPYAPSSSEQRVYPGRRPVSKIGCMPLRTQPRAGPIGCVLRSEERRVGKECR